MKLGLESHEIHTVFDSFLHEFLDFILVILRQVVTPAAAAGHGSLLGAGQLVVVLPGPVRHQVGVVGGGGVGNSPRAPRVQVTEVVGEHLKYYICTGIERIRKYNKM